MNSKKKKKKQLGVDPGTASHRLKKSLLFSFAKKLGYNWCYQCGTEIKDIDKLSKVRLSPNIGIGPTIPGHSNKNSKGLPIFATPLGYPFVVV